MIQNFIAHPIIKQLAIKPYWTINIDGKMPLNIVEYDKTKRLFGASSEACLTDVDNILRIVNAIPDHLTYHLDAIRDNIVVLDIEPQCPDDVKNQLLQLPFIYGEISMSGKGYHLVFPCPALDEITVNKVVMKEEHKWYEILIHHYVTFTYNMIEPEYNSNNAPVQFQTIWDELRKNQKLVSKREIDVNIKQIDLDFPQHDLLFESVIRNFRQRFHKKPIDFGNDMSRYEFAVIGSVRYSLITMLDLPIFAKKTKLTEEQQIALVYNIVKEILDHRAKHDEIRDGKPMLLYQVCNSFATVERKTHG